MNPSVVLPILFAHMTEKRLIDRISLWAQWAVILATNIFFVCKYIPRAGIAPVLPSIVYGLVAIGGGYLYCRYLKDRLSENIARVLSILLAGGIICFIACAIFLIDPYTIQVDRWSATSFFLDALRDGVYPYGVHTHVSETNYPSPFPLWHYLNLPFWLIGDVGWIQVFFLLVFLICVYRYFKSWRALLGVLLILYLSPAYWWELVTRSDGLSNALLVCSCLLVIERRAITMDKQWWVLAIIAGCLASTRLSAIIPVALYLFRPWLEANWKQQLGFIGIAALIVFGFFAPYIFWDTESWIFFQRNPFMSQTSPGTPWILGVMVLVAMGIAYKKTSFYYYLCTTSVFMFAFMLFTQLGVIYKSPEPVTLFDICCDISYFTLAVPYAIIALVHPTHEPD